MEGHQLRRQGPSGPETANSTAGSGGPEATCREPREERHRHQEGTRCSPVSACQVSVARSQGSGPRAGTGHEDSWGTAVNSNCWDPWAAGRQHGQVRTHQRNDTCGHPPRTGAEKTLFCGAASLPLMGTLGCSSGLLGGTVGTPAVSYAPSIAACPACLAPPAFPRPWSTVCAVTVLTPQAGPGPPPHGISIAGPRRLSPTPPWIGELPHGAFPGRGRSQGAPFSDGRGRIRVNTGQCTQGTLAWPCSDPGAGHGRPVRNHVAHFPFCRDELSQPRGSARERRGDLLVAVLRRSLCPSSTCGPRSVPGHASGMCAEPPHVGTGPQRWD